MFVHAQFIWLIKDYLFTYLLGLDALANKKGFLD